MNGWQIGLSHQILKLSGILEKLHWCVQILYNKTNHGVFAKICGCCAAVLGTIVSERKGISNLWVSNGQASSNELFGDPVLADWPLSTSCCWKEQLSSENWCKFAFSFCWQNWKQFLFKESSKTSWTLNTSILNPCKAGCSVTIIHLVFTQSMTASKSLGAWVPLLLAFHVGLCSMCGKTRILISTRPKA